MVIYINIINYNKMSLNRNITKAIKNNDVENLKNIINNNIGHCWRIRILHYIYLFHPKNIDMIKSLLSKNFININEEYNDITIYDLAYLRKDLKMIDMLLNNEIYGNVIKRFNFLDNTHIACMFNKLEIIKSSDNLNLKTLTNKTLLHIACQFGYLDIIKYLLENSDIDINALDDKDNTALYYAFDNKNVIIIKLLIEQPNIKLDNYAYLCRAIICNNIDSIKFLLNDDRFDPNMYDSNGYTVLHFAIMQNNFDIVKLLLEYPKINIIQNCKAINHNPEEGITSFHLACGHSNQTDDINIVKLLFETGKYNIDERTKCGHTSLYFACSANNIDVVKLLLEYGADPNIFNNVNDFTPLIIACFNGCSDIVNILLDDPRTDIKHHAQLPSYINCLQAACRSANIDIVKKLLDYPVISSLIKEKSKDGKTCLHYVCFSNSEKVCGMIKLLSEYDLFVTDNYGMTPLHEACRTGNLDTVKLLFSIYPDFDINTTNADGNTLLFFATETDNAELVSYLFDKGIDVNKRNNSGDTAFHYVVFKQRDISIMKTFIMNNNIDLNIINNDGFTPFNYACYKYTYPEYWYDETLIGGAIEYMINCDNIDCDTRDKNNKCPLEYLIESGDIYLQLVFDTAYQATLRCFSTSY